ncbi:MAG: hypothetical protein O7D86_04980 [Proteobacteria bacterium]|nr:hypothetical protein [Pseudomonadota bacterium]
MVSPGFAPFEQCVSKSDKQGPWTDIYGIGATLYRAVIGRSPSAAMDRSEGLLNTDRDTFVTASEINPEGYSPSLLSAIDHALAFKPDDRPQSITEWQSEIDRSVYVDQSEIETIVDPDHLKHNFDAADELAIEKTEILSRKDEIPIKKKSSLFRRIIKYALIGFTILFVLALLDNGNKEDADEVDEAVMTDDVPIVDQHALVEIEYDQVDFISDIPGEQESAEQLLHQAGLDIRTLRLSKPEGNNAVEKYLQILELDPGNVDAQDGLFNVASEYLKLTENSIHNKNLEKAGQYLELAKEISPDHPDIPTFENVLFEDIKAQEGLSNVATEYLKLTENSIHNKNFEKAGQYLELAKEINPNHPDIPQIEKVLFEEIQAHEEMLARESRMRDAPPSLITNEDKRQINQYKQRLKYNPKDRDARKEFESIIKTYEAKVKEAIDSGDFDTATAYLHEVQDIAPNSKLIKSLIRKIDKIRNK